MKDKVLKMVEELFKQLDNSEEELYNLKQEIHEVQAHLDRMNLNILDLDKQTTDKQTVLNNIEQAIQDFKNIIKE